MQWPSFRLSVLLAVHGVQQCTMQFVHGIVDRRRVNDRVEAIAPLGGACNVVCGIGLIQCGV